MVERLTTSSLARQLERQTASLELHVKDCMNERKSTTAAIEGLAEAVSKLSQAFTEDHRLIKNYKDTVKSLKKWLGAAMIAVLSAVAGVGAQNLLYHQENTQKTTQTATAVSKLTSVIEDKKQ